MASCDNFDLPNPPGQTNPEPDAVFENSGIQLAQSEATLNLVEANKANEDVNVATITVLLNFPAEYELEVQMEIAGDESFSNPVTIGTTIVDNNVMVNPDVLNGAIQESMTKKPGTYEVYARYLAFAVRENSRLRLGGLNVYFAEGSKYTVTTLDPVEVFEDAYYLVPCDAAGNLDYSKALKMNNTNSSVSVYDNPEFAVKVNIEESQAAGDGYLFMIAPQSAVSATNTDGVMGCKPANDLSGKLEVGADPGAIKIFGPILVTINLETKGYSLSYAIENLWPLSGSTQNKPSDALLLYTNDYIYYTGVSVLNKSWILAGQPDKNGAIIFKQDPDVEPVISEDGFSQTGVLTALSTGTSLRTPNNTAGLFWVRANIVLNEYEIYYLSKMSVIGNANGWDLATAVELTNSKDYKTWTATDVPINGEFKINANGAWDVSFSGTQIQDAAGEKVYQVDKQDGGENLSAPEGVYDVTLDFSTKPYILTLQPK